MLSVFYPKKQTKIYTGAKNVWLARLEVQFDWSVLLNLKPISYFFGVYMAVHKFKIVNSRQLCTIHCRVQVHVCLQSWGIFSSIMLAPPTYLSSTRFWFVLMKMFDCRPISDVSWGSDIASRSWQRRDPSLLSWQGSSSLPVEDPVPQYKISTALKNSNIRGFRRFLDFKVSRYCEGYSFLSVWGP